LVTPERWQQVERLYQSARAAHTTEERAKVLASADPDLRREVEALLANEPADSTETLATPRTLGTGFTIGHYRIESKLGEGGMGSVFRAHDTKLKRPVAIKFLSSDVADAQARRRFQREAQMASSLNHPHIVTVHDADEIDGRQYLVTEYIDGGTLKDWAVKERRSWKQTIELITGVADGLATAHEAGIIHRGIKPGNILVTKSGYAKLADFGLAKLAENASIDVAQTLTEGRTRPGMILGTIAYMSPEQASGLRLDARSDIFSFGVVLYELLAGKRPFNGAIDLEVLKTVIHSKPEPLGDEIPPTLRAIVEKALEKDPADRYQTMREMVVDLRRISREAPAARSPQQRVWLASAAAVLVLFGGVAAWRLWPRAGAPQEIRSIAVLPLRNLSGDPNQEYFSDGATEAIISKLAQIQSLRVISSTSILRYKGTQKRMPEIGRELGVDAIVEGSIQRAGGRVRIAAQLIRVATDAHLWAMDTIAICRMFSGCKRMWPAKSLRKSRPRSLRRRRGVSPARAPSCRRPRNNTCSAVTTMGVGTSGRLSSTSTKLSNSSPTMPQPTPSCRLHGI
jgi:serine/threonine protein kinase